MKQLTTTRDGAILWVGSPPEYHPDRLWRARLVVLEDWDTGEELDREIEVEHYRPSLGRWLVETGPARADTLQALALYLVERGAR